MTFRGTDRLNTVADLIEQERRSRQRSYRIQAECRSCGCTDDCSLMEIPHLSDRGVTYVHISAGRRDEYEWEQCLGYGTTVLHGEVLLWLVSLHSKPEPAPEPEVWALLRGEA